MNFACSYGAGLIGCSKLRAERPLIQMTRCQGGMLAASGRVWPAADGLPVEKRGVFFGRLVAQLLLHGSSFTTAGLEGVVRSALRG